MVTIGTWNLENLFSQGPFAPSTPTVYEAKLAGIAATILDHELDAVGVQEIGDQQAFDDLLARLGPGWSGSLSVHPDHRGIRVGVISRLPVIATQDVVDFPTQLAGLQADDSGARTTRMGRGALRARIPTPGGDLDLVVCHLKSKLVTYPGGRFQPEDEGERARFAAYALYRRAAEAATVRAFADTLLDGDGQRRRLAVVGDFNDAPEAATTQILQGPPGSELGTAGALRADRGDAWRLTNLAALLPEGQRATRVYRGRGELIDHMFVSHALIPAVTAVATVAPALLASITEVASDRRNRPASDHAMVIATLAIA